MERRAESPSTSTSSTSTSFETGRSCERRWATSPRTKRSRWLRHEQLARSGRQVCRPESLVAVEVTSRFDDLLLPYFDDHRGVVVYLELAVAGPRTLAQEDDDAFIELDDSLYRNFESFPGTFDLPDVLDPGI